MTMLVSVTKSTEQWSETWKTNKLEIAFNIGEHRGTVVWGIKIVVVHGQTIASLTMSAQENRSAIN